MSDAKLEFLRDRSPAVAIASPPFIKFDLLTLLLPGSSGDAAEEIAQAIRRAIEGNVFDLPDGSGGTASFGVSSCGDLTAPATKPTKLCI